jgi:hypothetical protein
MQRAGANFNQDFAIGASNGERNWSEEKMDVRMVRPERFELPT